MTRFAVLYCKHYVHVNIQLFRKHVQTYCQDSFICCLCACPLSKESLQVLHNHDRDGFNVEQWRALLLAVSFALDEACAVVVVVAVTVAVIAIFKRWIMLWYYCHQGNLHLYSSHAGGGVFQCFQQ